LHNSSTLKKGIKDYQTLEPTEAEATTLLNKMEVILKLTEEQLSTLVKNKERFAELKVGGMDIPSFCVLPIMNN
jgi:hypothetical protein